MPLKFLTLSATAVYLAGVLVGYQMEPDFGVRLQDPKSVLGTMDQAKSEMLWSIAGNNISVALINIGGGISFGTISFLNTFYNGAVLGYAFSVAGDNFPLAVIMRHLLPHAIEIIGIILSCSLGLYLGLHLFKKLILGRSPVFDYQRFLILVSITMIILLVAAVLEVYVSFSG
jgi:stage II sporulation protein M